MPVLSEGAKDPVNEWRAQHSHAKIWHVWRKSKYHVIQTQKSWSTSEVDHHQCDLLCCLDSHHDGSTKLAVVWCVYSPVNPKKNYLFLNFQKSIYSSMQLAWILHNWYNYTTTTNLPSLSWLIILCCQPNQTSTIFTETAWLSSLQNEGKNHGKSKQKNVTWDTKLGTVSTKQSGKHLAHHSLWHTKKKTMRPGKYPLILFTCIVYSVKAHETGEEYVCLRCDTQDMITPYIHLVYFEIISQVWWNSLGQENKS